MLTVKDLEEFENYMRSGELETDFKDGCENDRYYLLELLEKFAPSRFFSLWKVTTVTKTWPNWPTRRPPRSSSAAR